MKVTLRTKPLKDGNKSFYLDIYDNGQRRYEYLHLYLVPETNAAARRMNEEAAKKALELKSKYILGTYQAEKESAHSNEEGITLLSWIDTCMEKIDNGMKLAANPSYRANLMKKALEGHLTKIRKPQILLVDFGKRQLQGFLAYLKSCNSAKGKPFSACSLRNYQQSLVLVFNRAKREGLTKESPFNLLERGEKFPVKCTPHDFLTIEEIQRIADAKGGNQQMRTAFLFACLTGLRFSDIKSLKWGHIKQIGDCSFIVKEQKKTQVKVSIPLCQTALLFLPEHGGDDDLVFHLPRNRGYDKTFKRIVQAAGIDKHITFHSARRTFASLTIRTSHDMKTVSSLLGHTNVVMTQRYTDDMMDSRLMAVSLMDGAFE